MGLIHCVDCGESVSEHADKCPKCAYPLQRLRSPQQITANIDNLQASGGLITAGYIFAFLSILFFPIFLAIAGVIVGIVTISKGSTGHGVAHIILSIFFGIIGTIAGIVAWMF